MSHDVAINYNKAFNFIFPRNTDWDANQPGLHGEVKDTLWSFSSEMTSQLSDFSKAAFNYSHNTMHTI